MKFFNFIFCAFLVCFQSVNAFNVKVLLARIPKTSLAESPIVLKSTTGFFIGKSGKDQSASADKKIIISEKNGSLLINKKKISEKEISFRPQLSPKQNKDITSLVKSWIHDEKKNIEASFEKLEGLCDNLVLKKKHTQALESQKLEVFFLQWLHQFCEHLTRDKHNSQALQGSLQQAAKKQVYAHAKNCFVQKVSQLNISKSDYRKLGKDQKFRISFFYKVAVRCLQEIAVDFLSSLPDQDIRRVVKGSKHGIEYSSGTYWGEFYIIDYKDSYLIINCLDIDNYLVAVLHAEGWPGWPLEVNKTLIIAARSYLVFKILEAVRCKRLFHIKNTISHQTYKGYCKVHKNILRAAEETRDMIMTYKGKPVEAMFDSCCGGVIPAKISGFSFKKVPYLARTKVCTYCKPCWIYRWKSSFTQKQLLKKLQVAIPDLKRIRDIRVIERDDAKLVKKVMISDGKKKHYVTGKKMYSLFSEIKSFCFTTKRKNKQFIISGRGYGHHIGLCQWGARKMVDAHWNYKSILKFYYPGVEFMQLSYL
jgi:stage II sporulation protein D